MSESFRAEIDVLLDAEIEVESSSVDVTLTNTSHSPALNTQQLLDMMHDVGDTTAQQVGGEQQAGGDQQGVDAQPSGSAAMDTTPATPGTADSLSSVAPDDAYVANLIDKIDKLKTSEKKLKEHILRLDDKCKFQKMKSEA